MSYYHDDPGGDDDLDRRLQDIFVWTVIGTAGVLAVVFLLSLFFGPAEAYPAQLVKQSGATTVIGGCDENLWSHTYHAQRLQISERCASVTGVIVDATDGKRKQGCRSEADGDLHCWLTLDVWPVDQSKYLNQGNLLKQDGNLVFEPMCQHKVTQVDAMAACKNWHQDLKLPPVGTHVRITGAAVLDTQHGHREIHPVSSIEIIKEN
jgi:hypothetical protein